MAILFAIFKTILTVLLILLALILILILLILFVPFRYQAMGVNEAEQTEVAASVTWLLHMLAVDISYNLGSGAGLAKDIRLFGISLFRVRDWINNRKKSKAEKEAEKRRQEKRRKLEKMKTEDPERYERLKEEALARKREAKRLKEEEQRKQEEEARQEAERRKQEEEKKRLEEERLRQDEARKAEEARLAEENKTNREQSAVIEAEAEESENAAEPKEKLSVKIIRIIRTVYSKAVLAIQKILGKFIYLLTKLILIIWHIPSHIINKGAGIKNKIRTVFQHLSAMFNKAGNIIDFLCDERTQAVIELLKTQIGKLIGHILPRKLEGYLNFGLGDPYLTGRILAGACVFYPLYYRTFRLEPDFDELVFQGRAKLKGRIFIFYLVFIALAIILNKNVKYVINYIKSFNKEDSE